MTQKTSFLIIILLTLTVRVFHIAILYYFGTGFLIEDSPLYLQGADWLVRTGEFLMGPIESPHPETERMYGYVSIIALFDLIIGQPVWGVVIFQLLADCATVAFIVLSAARMGEKVGVVAGILAALWPNMILHSGLVLADTIALTAAAALLWSFIRFCEVPGFRRAVAVGVALGIGLAIRQGLLLLLPVIALLMGYIALRYRLDWRSGLAVFLAPLVISALFLLPQVERHREASGGRIVLTAQTGTHFLYWVTAEVYSAIEGGSRPEWAARFNQEYVERHGDDKILSHAGYFERSDALSTLALEKLQALPLQKVVFVWTSRGAVNLFVPSLAFHPVIRALKSQSFDQTSTSDGYASRVIRFLKNQPTAYVAALFLGFACNAFVGLFAAIGFVMGFRNNPLFSLIGVGYVSYIIVLNGPIAGAKYALPADLVIIVWTAYGLIVAETAISRRFRRIRS